MRHTKNLTSGNIKNEILFLAFPLIGGNILQQLYNTVDALVIGRFSGQEAFAAVGVSSAVMNLFLFLLSGICTGITILFARFFGSENWDSLRKEIFIGAVFGGGFTILLSIGAIINLDHILILIQTPDEIKGFAEIYLKIIFAGLILSYMYQLCAGLLRAAGNTGIALGILFISICMNLILDLLFISGLGMGIEGAAWATVLAQAVSALLGVFYIQRFIPQATFQKEDMIVDLKLLKQSAVFGAVSALHQSSLYLGKVMIQGAVNSQGTDIIAAYTAATRIEGFANSFGDSGAEAISIFVAQNYGGGFSKRAKAGFKTGLKIMAVMAAAMIPFMWMTGETCIRMLLGSQSLTAVWAGTVYIQTIAPFYLFCFIGSALVGWFRGSGQVKIPFIGTAMHITLRVVGTFLMIGKTGLWAVAAATGAGWIAVVIFQWVIFYRERIEIDEGRYS
ncbi:MAG: MATE family efflux transporter [Lachnoclostridium edouardi]|uniref:MATE family efflux transporter n=1 Tax=Lachnoclostridium edouardi TaxID=1926283 RepID=UPI0026DB5B49|nr:MATE family efflux transporter [Lachnoclostridium edouardi]MDO4278824.1 MATE family efflux transporter [Lachnoclostridium edouardi]